MIMPCRFALCFISIVSSHNGLIKRTLQIEYESRNFTVIQRHRDGRAKLTHTKQQPLYRKHMAFTVPSAMTVTSHFIESRGELTTSKEKFLEI